MFRYLLPMAAGIGMLSAQTIGGGPSLGYIFDARGQALRPILGIPGASVFGDPINTSTAISAASISLRQNAAIVNDGAWNAIQLSPGSAATPLPDGLAAGARAVVSESASAAAFFDAASTALTIVTGIATGSMAAHAVALDALPGPITQLAIADDGSLLLSASLAAGPTPGGEALFWIDQNGARQLTSLQSTASILLSNHGATAVVADRAANQVWKIQDPAGSAAITLLASDADGVSGPAGAALSADGGKLWVANSTTHTVLGIDVAGRTAVSLNCACDLTTLQPMADGSSFRLNDLTSGPVWILDAASGADARVVFVPAIQAPAPSEEAAQ